MPLLAFEVASSFSTFRSRFSPCTKAPASGEGEVPTGTKLQLLLSSPGGFAPLKSDPTEWTAAGGGGNGACAFSFRRAFRQEATPEALHLLVQPGAVRLSVHEAGSSAQLAHADVDIAQLALGRHEWSASGLVLVPVEAVGPGATFKVSLDLEIQIWTLDRISNLGTV